MRYDGVIFDKDGVLLDSMSDDFRWADDMRVRLAKKRGIEMAREESLEIVRANTEEEVERAAEKIGLKVETVEKIEKEIAKKKIDKMRKGEIGLFKDTRPVLEQLEMPKSIVSNAPYQTTRFTVENFELEHYFETVLSPGLDDLREFTRLKKPNPEMLKKAIDEMNASNPVMIGDSDDDIKAAENAGIDSIFVNTNGGTELSPTHKVERLKNVLNIVT